MNIESIVIEDAVERLLNWLSAYGLDSKGGISRLLYTEDWVKAQKSLVELLRKKGFKAYEDEIGDVFGRLEGTKYQDETILTGSHIDTVINGGKYDGQFGIIAGIVAMEYLKNNYGLPIRNIEVVSIAEEEGSRFPYNFWGSKNIIDAIDREEVEELRDADGISFSEAINKAGYQFKDKNTSLRGDVKAFIELHVEQGQVLERKNIGIGLVENIVGQRRFLIEVKGQANHAGTTPMAYRKDALYISSKLIQEIIESAIEFDDQLVATVGSLEVVPNTVNVVPGSCKLSLDIRHISKEKLDKFNNVINKIIKEISSKFNANISINKYMDEQATPMDKDLLNLIQLNCEEDESNYLKMNSGAGHDAQIFAKAIPTALIFVPSHSPDELTSNKDLAVGVKLLIKMLLELAYK